MFSAALSAVLVALAGAALLGWVWLGVRAAIARLNSVWWAREWERVEPEWTGRA